MNDSDPITAAGAPKAAASSGSRPASDAADLDRLLAPDRRSQLIKGIVALVLAIIVLSLPFQYADFQLDRFAKVTGLEKRGIDAVSYTHLDVYKRQFLSCELLMARL